MISAPVFSSPSSFWASTALIAWSSATPPPGTMPSSRAALYVTNDKTHDLLGYVVFTYTFHLWAKDKKDKDQSVPGG